MLPLMMKVSPSKLLLLLAPLMLANCKSTKGGGTTASTPSHNMSRSEYPFDENGNYHEEWVKGNDTNANVVDLTKNNPPSVFTGTTDPRDADTPPATKPRVSSSGGGKPASKPSSKPTSKPTVASKPKPKPKPKPPAPKFTTVTVKKGDTLYGLAQRYSVSVGAIQSANGMGSSTNLKDGRSLKIPK
jgi:LysM repeat protein